ncbi:DNA polymerase III [Sorangium cellulosum]|uniref:DNA-directed DNA polymerase n=1 Tax=Sorangium cellulosum TaxID=56 RepID=A0A2L0FB65_SORCE|nr:PHP domain-containing protein [Sorangium cellulosum]AUX48669.1 DNA polymerase III [Sorangium cellulosum]
MPDKLDIARALREMGMLLQIKGENPFKARAYETGADALEELTDDLGALVAAKKLTSLRGIGAALAAQIAELYQTGRSEQLERLRAELPRGVLELSQVPGMTLKRMKALHEALGIGSVEELKQACLTGKVRAVKGFGAKIESSLLEGIHRYETHDERVLLVDALELAEPLLGHVRGCEATEQAELAGDIRRWEETVARIDLVAAADDAEQVIDCFVRSPHVAEVEERAGPRCSVRLSGGLRGELLCVPPRYYAAALHHHTGAPAHLEALAALAREQGLSLDERGLLRGNKRLPVKTEEDLYRHLGLPFIAPELREGEGEIEAAAAGRAADEGELIEEGDIQGMVHCHTVYSDGKNTIEEMALEAEAMGMKYLTITDHSPAAHYAGGVGVDRLKQQWDEIARVQEKVKVKLLRGTESDILESGALDYPDDILEQFDVIIASIHSRMKMDADQMTRRLVKAMKQPVFKIWGHALGRLIQRREPFACRVEEVLDAVAESRAAVEVNGDPYRLDMQPRWLKEARKRGIRFVISTDAHSTNALHNLRFGVGTARRGGLRRGEVLNALGPAAFRKAVRPAA